MFHHGRTHRYIPRYSITASQHQSAARSSGHKCAYDTAWKKYVSSYIVLSSLQLHSPHAFTFGGKTTAAPLVPVIQHTLRDDSDNPRCSGGF